MKFLWVPQLGAPIVIDRTNRRICLDVKRQAVGARLKLDYTPLTSESTSDWLELDELAQGLLEMSAARENENTTQGRTDCSPTKWSTQELSSRSISPISPTPNSMKSSGLSNRRIPTLNDIGAERCRHWVLSDRAESF